MKTLRLGGFCFVSVFLFLSGYVFRSALAQEKSAGPQTVEKLPPDIYPESLARLPWPSKDEFTSDEEKEAYETCVKLAPQNYHTSGPLGPTPLRTHMPVVAEHYYRAFRWIRDKSGLPRRYVELSILVSARESNDQYLWVEHEEQSVPFLPRETVEAVRNRKELKGLDEKDAALIQYAREMYHQPIVSPKTFAEMERLFGRKYMMAATQLMAHYTAHALLLHAYDQHLPPGVKPPLTVPASW